MSEIHRDKILHFFVSAVLVVLFYLLQTLRPLSGRLGKNDYRLLFSAIASLCFGILKEILDFVSRYASLPWCNDVCHADFWDVLLNINGITAAILLLIIVHVSFCSRTVQPRIDDETDAATVSEYDTENQVIRDDDHPETEGNLESNETIQYSTAGESRDTDILTNATILARTAPESMIVSPGNNVEALMHHHDSFIS
jgi:hypothetical protein